MPPPHTQSLKKNSTKENFSSKLLIGLQNVGVTCYMNATLQCLCNIEKFIDYFKYNDRLNEIVKNDNQNKTLSKSFKNLIEKFWYYWPYEFKDKISKMCHLFEGIQAKDAKDLINFLIMTLYSELNNAQHKHIEKKW